VLRKQKEKQLKEQEEQEQDIEDVITTHSGDPFEEDQDPRMEWGADQLRPQRIKCKPVRDCYYTAEEAEAGDPLLVEDPAEKTTDSEDDGWDEGDPSEDEDFDPDVEMEDTEMVQRDHLMSQSP
jgi:hypothetical protein